jgi:excisionase family DNA binding protein
MQEQILQKLKSIEAILLNQEDKPLSFREAHEYLGVSLSYLYKLTSQNKIPHYKPNGKMIYFSKIELDNWIKKNPVRVDNKPANQRLTDSKHISSGRANKNLMRKVI